ncbi:MAG: deoxyribodipyrimidine photo-lyase, partial [Marinovum sp.]|nr:deoxyribodipyrimidine photo-lyase [Marinovum sp.]
MIYWVRRDLRLADNPAFTAAVQSGKPVLPVAINDQLQKDLGAAPKWRLGLGLEKFSASLDAIGSKLILRSGDPQQVLETLMRETGADYLVWNRIYETKAMARDSAIKQALKQRGIKVDSFGGAILFEPMSVETKTGGFYRVFTPFWNAVKSRDVAAPLPKVMQFKAPSDWPRTEILSDWNMAKAMGRGADVM